MHTSDIYQGFAQLFTADERAQALASLRQDGYVWQRLQQADYFEQAQRSLGSALARWTPGTLALLALKIGQDAAQLAASPMLEVDSSLVGPMMQVYQNAHASQTSGPETFEEAGLLALALRERRRKLGNWSFLSAELQQHTGPHGETPTGWRCATACLYSLVPDSENLLRALLAVRQSYEWMVHTRLSQPLSQQEHLDVLAALLKEQPLETQLGVLRSLNLHGRENLVRSLAGMLVVDHPAFAVLRSQTGLVHLNLSMVVTRAFMLHQLASLYQVSGNRTQAASLLHSAESTLQHWAAGMYLQEMNLGAAGSRPDDAKLSAVLEQSRRLAGELGAVIGSQSLPQDVLKSIVPNLDDPVLQIREAVQLASQGELALARELAGQAVARLVEKVNSLGLPFWGEFVYEWDPIVVLKSLMGLGLSDEALSLARVLIMARPADTRLMNETGLICEQMRDLPAAREYAQATAGLEPAVSAWRRRLGQLWMDAGDWKRAVVEYEAVLALSAQPAITDSLAYARAALRCGMVERVVAVCEAVLKESPDTGAAAGLLGQALAAQGDLERAVACLSRATLYAPEEPDSWLALARIQREQGESQRALETLRSAVLAIPETAPQAAETNLVLGELCLQNGLVSEALPALKQAFSLNPQSFQAGYLYGKTLYECGKPQEARSVLESTRPAWESHREMAYCYAVVAQELHDLENMLSAIEQALRPSSTSGWGQETSGEASGERTEWLSRVPVEWDLLYTRLMLGDLPEFSPEAITAYLSREVRLYRAEQSIHRILEQEPAHYEGRFYKAQVLLERGESEPALALYRSLAEIQRVPEHELYWRVQWGIGRAAQHQGFVDTALVALKEACQSHPDSIYLQRDLAEACLKVDLTQEALMAAQYALQLSPDHVDNLVWFAHFVLPLGERRTALEALECSVQLEPARHDLRIELAEWQIQSGNLAAGRAHLDVLRKSSQVNADSLRKAAGLYKLMDDPQAALECLEYAMNNQESPSFDLLYDVARLLERLGRDEEALFIVQRALADLACGQSQDSISLYLLQSDLLSRLGRTQGALASLEKVLRVAEDLMQGGVQDPALLQDEMGGIHERFSSLLVEVGNLPEAFYHAEKALDIHPERMMLRYKAAGLALSTLQLERAARITENIKTDIAGLACLKVEVALEIKAGSDIDWTALEDEMKECACRSNEPRMFAAHSRLLARRGDWLAARQAFEQAQAAAAPAGADSPVELWLAEAALETHDWKTALALFEAYTHRKPNEPRGFFAYARALVLCAEYRRTCVVLGCQSHSPDPGVLGEENRGKFEEAIQSAARLSNNQGSGALQITRWRVRGQAVFQPSMQAARDLAALPPSPEDTAAMVTVLGLLNRRSVLNQTVQKDVQAACVRMQIALYSMSEADSLVGLEIARTLTEEQPDHPLYHALRARLAMVIGSLPEALEAYENALCLWPGEAGWHNSAGDLAFALDKAMEGMTHREQALALDPSNVSYALKLGEACMAGKEPSRAVEVLEAASRIEKDRPEIWLALSQAYRQAGSMPQALEAALYASQIDQDSGKGYLLAAETSLALDQGEEALNYARSAVAREPEDTDSLLFLAQVLELQGTLGEAARVLEEAPLAIRDLFEVAFERARLLYRLKGAQAVLEVLEKLAADYPDDDEVLAFLAFIQYEAGNFRAAERSGFKSLRLNPNQPELALLLGRLQHKAGQLDQAVYLLSEAVRMSPDHLEAFLELGTVYQERRETGQALQVFRQAMRITPTDYRAYYRSGILLRDDKDYAGAEAMLRRAVDLAQDNAGIRRQLLAVIALNLVHNKQEAGVAS